MKRYYDVIVVGAGPAGAAAAKVLGDNQVSTLLLERGRFPGAKNVFGGAIYSKPTSELIPAFWKDAPIERIITKEGLWFLDQDSAVKMGFTGLKYGKEPYNKITTTLSSYSHKLQNSFFMEDMKRSPKMAKMASIVKDMQHPFKTMGDLYYGIKDWSV